MVQFDALIIFPLTFNLILSLCLYYGYQINSIIPKYVKTKKFRFKKIFDLKFFESKYSLVQHFFSTKWNYDRFLSNSISN